MSKAALVELLKFCANGSFPTEKVQKLLVLPTMTRPRQAPAVRNLQRRLSAAEVRDVVESYQAGATAVELGKRFSVNRQTILKTLERQGVGRHYNLLDDDQAEILRERYEAGASLKQLGEECGVDAGTVRRALLRIGAATRPRPGT